jgi:hypothetical protein
MAYQASENTLRMADGFRENGQGAATGRDDHGDFIIVLYGRQKDGLEYRAKVSNLDGTDSCTCTVSTRRPQNGRHSKDGTPWRQRRLSVIPVTDITSHVNEQIGYVFNNIPTRT